MRLGLVLKLSPEKGLNPIRLRLKFGLKPDFCQILKILYPH